MLQNIECHFIIHFFEELAIWMMLQQYLKIESILNVIAQHHNLIIMWDDGTWTPVDTSFSLALYLSPRQSMNKSYKRLSIGCSLYYFACEWIGMGQYWSNQLLIITQPIILIKGRCILLVNTTTIVDYIDYSVCLLTRTIQEIL